MYLAAILATLALALTGCLPDADGGDPDRAEAPTSADAADDDASSPATDPDDPADQASGPVEEDPPLLELPGVGSIDLTTPAAGGGPYPTLAWEPVADAARYSVTVHDGDGSAYWAWTTSDTEVVVGGRSSTPGGEHASGPRIYEPMSWYVVATDQDGRVIAQSGQRPIAP